MRRSCAMRRICSKLAQTTQLRPSLKTRKRKSIGSSSRFTPGLESCATAARRPSPFQFRTRRWIRSPRNCLEPAFLTLADIDGVNMLRTTQGNHPALRFRLGESQPMLTAQGPRRLPIRRIIRIQARRKNKITVGPLLAAVKPLTEINPIGGLVDRAILTRHRIGVSEKHLNPSQAMNHPASTRNQKTRRIDGGEMHTRAPLQTQGVRTNQISDLTLRTITEADRAMKLANRRHQTDKQG